MAARTSRRGKAALRRLAAVLSADVAGYSRLMGADEETTIDTLTAYRKVFLAHVEGRRGRVVDAKGDAILAEFGSVVDATTAAVEIQKELAKRNTGLPKDRRMEFRIGINLGDVVVKDDVIYGDGVNVAARMESLAEPGGICLSGFAFDQVEGKLPLPYESIGEQSVKNIAKPVRTYRVRAVAGGEVPRGALPGPGAGVRRRRVVQAAALIVLAVSLAAGGWFGYRSWAMARAVADLQRNAALKLPDKPSLAVLPFTNLSGDPDQDAIADAFAENLITDLSRTQNLFVIARNSSFSYKGKAVDVREVGRELGVRYILEGSLQRAGEKLRVNAQLIDAATGRHVWGNRFDRPARDLFAVEDEIGRRIVLELEVKLTEGEQARARRRHTASVEAFESFARGVPLFRRFRREDNLRARKWFEQALASDPHFADALGWLGWTHWAEARYGWGPSRKESLQQAERLANQAREADDTVATSYSLLSFVHLARGEFDKALSERQRVIALSPNAADAHALMALLKLYAGQPQEAIVSFKTAMRLSPFYPSWFLGSLGQAYRMAGYNEEALRAFREVISREPLDVTTARVRLASLLVELGRIGEAREVAAKILEINPRFSVKRYAASRLYRDRAVVERIAAQLRQTGLPD